MSDSQNTSSSSGRFAIAVLLMVSTWLSVNAIWGLTSDSDTLLSGWLREIMPLGLWSGVGVLASIAIVVAGLVSRNGSTQLIGFMLAAYLGGVAISRFAYDFIDPRGGVPFDSFTDTFFALWERSFLLWPAIPMLAVYFVYLRKHDAAALRFGAWRSIPAETDETSWWYRLGGFILCVVLPLAVFMQLSVGFGPITSGTMFIFLIPVAMLALFNAFTEELLFRGFLQSAFTAYLGVKTGIIVQGVYFGFHHWGASPDLVAGLPTALVLCGLGIYWGYSVRETGGIGWAVITHALVDWAFFSAHFVKSE